MKKLSLLTAIAVLSLPLFAGGLKTNTNQSATWARTLTREASTGVDAVYFNPAGLSHLKKGLSLSVSNQSIFQTRTIVSDYPYLDGSPKTYEAELTAPLYPSIYAAYKMEKLTISGGFNIIGGGGTADFQQGLPDFEVPVSGLVPGLVQQLTPLDQGIELLTGTNPGFANINGYNMDMGFSGSSNYFGVQLNATYAIMDMLSVAIGGRYVIASNSYEGSISGITINAPAPYGGTQTAGTYLRTIAMTPGLDAATVATLNGTADALDVQTGDQNLKATQSGSGFTPIIGVHLHLTDMINVAAKYEHRTKIELENETETDDTGMFPDGEKVRADLPGHFTLGAQVQPIKKITASVGFNYFLDKSAYYGNVNAEGEQINSEMTIDENSWTLSAGVEWRMIGPLGISAGYSFGNLGINDDYQSGLSYANKSSTIAGGLFFELGSILVINAGYVHVMYDDYEKAYEAPMDAYGTTYGKKTGIFAIGVDIML